MQIGQRYFRATSIAGFSKIYTAIGALAVLWLINAIVGKAGLGLVMSAYALCYILGSVVAAWARAIIMYHISRQDEDDAHANKTGACLFYTLVLGLGFALVVYLSAPWLAAGMDKPDVQGWLRGMGFLIPAFALNAGLTSWYRARQDVARMVAYFEIWPATLRVIAFGVIYAAGGAPGWIVVGYVTSFLLPFFVLYMRRPLPVRLDLRHLSRWDMRHGAQVSLNQVLTKSVNNLVIVLLGFLASSATVAEFTLAMRVTLLLQFPKLALAQLQVPRMGRYMRGKEYSMLKSEFDVVRTVGLGVTMAGVAMLALAGPWLLHLFGDYADSYPLIMLLAVAALIRVGFGTLGGYLTIAGYSGRAFIVNALSFCVLLGGIAWLVPVFGAAGAAMATVLAAATAMLCMTGIIFHADHIWLQTAPVMFVTALAIAGVAGHVYAGVSGIVLTGLLIALALGMGFYALHGYSTTLKGREM